MPAILDGFSWLFWVGQHWFSTDFLLILGDIVAASLAGVALIFGRNLLAILGGISLVCVENCLAVLVELFGYFGGLCWQNTID